MNQESMIARFEAELGKVQREGMDELLGYIRRSDFYTAPASTKYHLSCPGGLLQHSLNVLDALRGLLVWNPQQEEWEYQAAGVVVDTIPDESVILTALLHDVCKTYFYQVGTRNVKDSQTKRWKEVPSYSVHDVMPLGHGPKSAMIVKEYVDLNNREFYSIWWHMGYTMAEGQDRLTLGTAIEKYPFILALHTADMMASRFMEDTADNAAPFRRPNPDDETGEAAMNEHMESETQNTAADPTGGYEEAPPLEPTTKTEASESGDTHGGKKG